MCELSQFCRIFLLCFAQFLVTEKLRVRTRTTLNTYIAILA